MSLHDGARVESRVPVDPDPVLVVRELTASFETERGPLTAVDGVSFELRRGETLGVVGESGSGKTVLVRSIMRLLPERGLSLGGSVRFEGSEILNASLPELRSLWGARVSMIFQDPMSSLNPVVRIGRQITESLRLHLKVNAKEAKQMALTLLGEVGIPSPEQRFRAYPHQLSGGMRQRVMIAIAMACRPSLVLADEPTTSLDVTIQAQILDLLATVQEAGQMSVILISHDLRGVATRCDRIAVMYAGRLVELAPSQRLYRSMAMHYTKALIDATPQLSAPSHKRLSAIDGRPPDLAALPPGCAFAPRCPAATERCRQARPPLVPHLEDPGHLFACWNPLGAPQSSPAKGPAS